MSLQQQEPPNIPARESRVKANEVNNSDEFLQKSSGRWSKEEHKLFVEGLIQFGKNWKKVEEHIGTRTGAQIRSHAQ